MGLPIVGYGSGNGLEIFPTPANSAKVTQVDSAGNELYPNLPLYCCQISIVPTTVTTGTVYWVLRASATKKIQLLWWDLGVSFNGTAGATNSLYEIIRLSAGTFTANLTPSIIYPSTASACLATAANGAAGVTLTGPTYETNGPVIIGHANQLGPGFSQDLVGALKGWEIPVNQGVAIRASGAVLAGSSLKGGMLFAEY
jgi:hypothetical protein